VNHCKHPDCDVPKLVCGYPLPCPHHTVIIDGATLLSPDDEKRRNTLANLRWLQGRCDIRTYFTLANNSSVGLGEIGSGVVDSETNETVISVRTVAVWSKKSVPFSTRSFAAALPIHASLVEIRNAIEEQQIDARAWLEEHLATPAWPVTDEDVVQATPPPTPTKRKRRR
jgi:hypothetical protein